MSGVIDWNLFTNSLFSFSQSRVFKIAIITLSLKWPKKLWDQLLKYGKIPLLSLLTNSSHVLCFFFSHRGKRIAIILTETTQQKHGPLLSVYCIMGVTGYLSPILRSLLVFPTRYDSFTTARFRPGLFLTSWTAAVLRLSHNLSLSFSLVLLTFSSPLLSSPLSLFHFLSL